MAGMIISMLPRAAFGDPGSDYMLHCQGCHGPSGAGVPGNVPSFRGEVAKFLAGRGWPGVSGESPGDVSVGASDARTAQLLNWLVREFDAEHVPAGFVPYSEAEVARLRRPALTDVSERRAELIRSITPHLQPRIEAEGHR